MKLSLHRVRLPLANPFTISRGTRTAQSSLYVVLEHDGLQGYGEVAENSFYGHTLESMADSLSKVQGCLGDYVNQRPQDVWQSMHDMMQGDLFALSALDIAAHDWRGKKLGIPTWQDWGLDWEQVCHSSYTIGIDSIDTMITKLQTTPNWDSYKIKLGTDHDLEIVAKLREHTDARFRVDANCGWTVNQCLENAKVLAELGVESIEQPLPIEAPTKEKLQLYQESALPILADEDSQVVSDVEKCHGVYHGINVKVAKCGGLSPALQMLQRAKELGMKTMIGCMIESSIAISGAAQLLPLLDFADLDGAVLLKDEPASGVLVKNGVVQRPNSPGTGSQIEYERLISFNPDA